MSAIVYRTSVLLSAILAEVPVGTNLGLFWLLCALMSGRFLLSRGTVFPALAGVGMPAEAVRRAGVWTLGDRDPRAGLATGGPTGRPLTGRALGRVSPGGL